MNGHLQPLFIEAGQVHLAAKDPDGPGEGAGLGDDVVGTHRDVVATACGVVAHGDDHGLLCAGQGNLAPDGVAGRAGATGRVDPEHHRRDVFIFACVAQLAGEGAVADVAAAEHLGAAVAADDGALGVDDRDGLVAAQPVSAEFSEVVAHLAAILTDLFEDLIPVGQCIDHAALQGDLGVHWWVVDEGFGCDLGQSTPFSDAAEELTVEGVKQGVGGLCGRL